MKPIFSMTRLATPLLGALFFFSSPAHACGFHNPIAGGLEVSYPGGLGVAVAVAKARRQGLLPQDETPGVEDEALFDLVLEDLRALQSRLGTALPDAGHGEDEHFSLVLVGPGLWSHFHVTRTGVLADYHVDGPIPGKAVVMTHPSVLGALVQGTLTIDEAVALGLLAFSGNDADAVRQTLLVGLRSAAGQPAASADT